MLLTQSNLELQLYVIEDLRGFISQSFFEVLANYVMQYGGDLKATPPNYGALKNKVKNKYGMSRIQGIQSLIQLLEAFKIHPEQFSTIRSFFNKIEALIESKILEYSFLGCRWLFWGSKLRRNLLKLVSNFKSNLFVLDDFQAFVKRCNHDSDQMRCSRRVFQVLQETAIKHKTVKQSYKAMLDENSRFKKNLSSIGQAFAEEKKLVSGLMLKMQQITAALSQLNEKFESGQNKIQTLENKCQILTRDNAVLAKLVQQYIITSPCSKSVLPVMAVENQSMMDERKDTKICETGDAYSVMP